MSRRSRRRGPPLEVPFDRRPGWRAGLTMLLGIAAILVGGVVSFERLSDTGTVPTRWWGTAVAGAVILLLALIWGNTASVDSRRGWAKLTCGVAVLAVVILLII